VTHLSFSLSADVVEAIAEPAAEMVIDPRLLSARS
jgi:hypothetical protein